MTPIEAWSEMKPTVKHFKTFGSICYTHIADAKRSKLDNKAEMGIFLGYAMSSKGYRVYNLQSKKIVISRIFKWMRILTGIGRMIRFKEV